MAGISALLITSKARIDHTEIGDADQKARSEPYGGTQRRFRLAHLARRYTQDVAVAADDGDRRRGYRGRNLFARAGRSFEWITGARDKRQRALACRRRPAFAPRGLRSRHAASPASGCFRFGFAVPPD